MPNTGPLKNSKIIKKFCDDRRERIKSIKSELVNSDLGNLIHFIDSNRLRGIRFDNLTMKHCPGDKNYNMKLAILRYTIAKKNYKIIKANLDDILLFPKDFNRNIHEDISRYVKSKNDYIVNCDNHNNSIPNDYDKAKSLVLSILEKSINNLKESINYFPNSLASQAHLLIKTLEVLFKNIENNKLSLEHLIYADYVINQNI